MSRSHHVDKRVAALAWVSEIPASPAGRERAGQFAALARQRFARVAVAHPQLVFDGVGLVQAREHQVVLDALRHALQARRLVRDLARAAAQEQQGFLRGDDQLVMLDPLAFDQILGGGAGAGKEQGQAQPSAQRAVHGKRGRRRPVEGPARIIAQTRAQRKPQCAQHRIAARRRTVPIRISVSI
ncbi:hypothetical protein CBM2637_B20071 [Cupriavidus taiwanensis]|nr:hypothetical protein CBM2637_B20071 [Cupriavidus taiwanensis]